MRKAMTSSCRSSKCGHAGGQTILEYAIMLGVVTSAILAMQIYAKRGIQSVVKLNADQLGDQADGIRYESGERQNRVIPEGRTLARKSQAAIDINSNGHTIEEESGRQTRIIDDTNTAHGVLAAGGVTSSSTVISDVR